MKKIDAHLHVAQIIAGYCRRGELRAIGNGKAVWANGEQFDLIPAEYGDTNFTIETAIQIMDRYEVEKAVLMQGSMYGFQNQYHYEIMNQYPERFCPSCTVDPFSAGHLDTLDYLLRERNFRLVKLEVSSGGGLMGCHDPFQLADDRMMSIYEKIHQYGAVLALDIGDCNMASYQPDQVADIALAFPQMKIVVCHLLAPIIPDRNWISHINLLRKENIWFDIAALPKIVDDHMPYKKTIGILKTAKDLLGPERLLWGTDAPFAATRDSYERLTNYLTEGNAFSKEELQKIYYDNAEQVYFKNGKDI